MSFLKKIGGLVLGIVGAVVGFIVAGPVGAAYGFALGAGIGGMMQAQAMQGRIPETSSATTDRLNISIDPEAPRKIAFGETALGTDQIYWEVFGPENSYFDQVIAAAGHKIESFGKLYFDDEEVTFTGNNAGGAYAGALTKEDRTVGVTGTALSVGAGAKWISTASMTGCAHYALKIKWSREKYPRGIPNRITRVGKGALVYDPRRDSTVPGGSGTHRADDQSTWEYSPLDGNGVPIGRNPALQILWYEIGWRVQNPSTSEWMLVAGRGRPLDDIDFSAFVTAANDCEDQGYYSDVLLSTGDAHETNIAVLESACAGKVMDNGGRIGLRIRTDTTGDIVQTFTDDDVVDSDVVNWIPRLPLSQCWNQVVGSFVDPRALYKLVPLPMVRDTTYETEDGFKKPGPPFRFDAVQDPEQAQKLMRLELNMSRYQGVFTAPFNWRAKKVQVWDCVTLTFPRFGFSNKVFRVIEKRTAPMGAIWLLLREDDPSIYTGGTVTAVPAPGATAGYDARVVSSPIGTDWTITPVYIEGGGAKIPALQIAGSTPAANIVAAHIYFRQGVSGDWIYQGRYTAGSLIRSQRTSIALNTSYYGRIIYENAFGVRSSPTDIGPYTSPTDFNAFSAQIADGIIGQGWGATATEEQASNAKLPLGANAVINSDFKRGLFGYLPGWNGGISVTLRGLNYPGQFGARNVLHLFTTGTPSSSDQADLYAIGPYFIGGGADHDRTFGMPCKGGDRVYAGWDIASVRCTVEIKIRAHDASGSLISETVVGSGTGVVGEPTGDPANFSRVGGFWDVPAGTAYVGTWVRMVGAGQFAPSVWATDPLLCRVAPGQTTAPPYTPGRADPESDKTEENIPANTALNLSATLNPTYPLSSTASSISIAAVTVSWPSNSVSLPAATISGLSADTAYAVFWNKASSTYLAISSAATAYYTDVSGYIALGTQKTAISGTTYSPPPPPPSGGGGGSYPGLPSIP